MELYDELLKLAGIELDESEQILLTEGIAELKRQYPNISDNDYQQLIQMDPTYKGGNEIGKFGRWILDLYNLFVKDRLAEEKYEKAKAYVEQHPEAKMPPAPVQKSIDKIEDFQKLPDLLSKFVKLAKDIKQPITNFKSVADLASAVRASEEQNIQVDEKAETNYQIFRDAMSDGLKVVYQDNDWVIGIPETYEASSHFKDPVTDWCTAYPDMYERYMEEYGGKYYIHLNKHTGDLYQMHFESDQFKDASDAEIDKYAFIKTYPNLKGFYTKLLFKPENTEKLKNYPSFTSFIDIPSNPADQYQFLSKNPEFIGQASFDVAKKLLANDIALLRYVSGLNPNFLNYAQLALDAAKQASSGVRRDLIDDIVNMLNNNSLKINKEQKTEIYNDVVQKIYSGLDSYDKPFALDILAPKVTDYLNSDNYFLLLNDLVHTEKYIPNGGYLLAPMLKESKTNFDHLQKAGITPYVALKNYKRLAYRDTYFYEYIRKAASAADFERVFNDDFIPRSIKERVAVYFYGNLDEKANAVIDDYFISTFKTGNPGSLLIGSKDVKKQILAKYFKNAPISSWLENNDAMSATNEEINDALVESGIIPTLSDEDLAKIALHPDWEFLRGPLIEYMLSTNKLDALKQVGEKITPNIQNSVLKSIAQSNSFTPESIDAATGIFKKIIQKRFFEFLDELGWTLKYKQPYADAIIEKLTSIIQSDRALVNSIKSQLGDPLSIALSFIDYDVVSKVLFSYPNLVKVLYEKMPKEITKLATETGHLDALKDAV